MPFVRGLLRLNELKRPAARQRLEQKLKALNEQFRRDYGEDAFELCIRVFGDK